MSTRHLFFKFFLFVFHLFCIFQNKKIKKIVTLDPRHETLDPRQKDRLFCLPLLYPQITLTYSFLPKSSYFSTESAKFRAFKKCLGKKIKIFKLLVEILRLSWYKLGYKQIVPFSSSQSSTLRLYNVGNLARDTSCDSV